MRWYSACVATRTTYTNDHLWSRGLLVNLKVRCSKASKGFNGILQCFWTLSGLQIVKATATLSILQSFMKIWPPLLILVGPFFKRELANSIDLSRYLCLWSTEYKKDVLAKEAQCTIKHWNKDLFNKFTLTRGV